MTFDIKTISYREKIVWVNLIMTVSLFGYYFYSVLTQGLDGGQAVWLYLKVVAIAIIAEIIVISILAARNKTQDTDERDKLYETRGFRWGYYVLFVGVLVALWQTVVASIGDLVMDHPQMGEKAQEVIVKFSEHASPFLIIHIMLGTLILAEIAKSAVQLFYYRRGY